MEPNQRSRSSRLRVSVEALVQRLSRQNLQLADSSGTQPVPSIASPAPENEGWPFPEPSNPGPQRRGPQDDNTPGHRLARPNDLSLQPDSLIEGEKDAIAGLDFAKLYPQPLSANNYQGHTPSSIPGVRTDPAPDAISSPTILAPCICPTLEQDIEIDEDRMLENAEVAELEDGVTLIESFRALRASRRDGAKISYTAARLRFPLSADTALRCQNIARNKSRMRRRKLRRHASSLSTAAINVDIPNPAPTRLELVTDSGYGSKGANTMSCGEGNCLPETVVEADESKGIAKPSKNMTQENDDDAKTVYSDTISLRHQRINNYVVAFANEICDSLPTDFSREDLERISDSLPAAFKASASMMDCKALGGLERQIKYIMHRYRLQIINLVRRRLAREFRSEGGDSDSEDDDIPDSSRNSEAEMSFHDKISEWVARCNVTYAEETTCPENKNPDEEDGLSEDGVDKMEVDENELSGLPQFRQVLTQSWAYRWLLSLFQSQREMVIPGGQPCIGSHISRSVTEMFHPKKRFSRSDSLEVSVFFELDWDPLAFYKEQQYEIPIEDALERAVTLTGYGNDVQVTTCRDYFSQTWPETGLALLQFMQTACKVVTSKRDEWTGTLQGRTLVRAYLSHNENSSRFVVQLTGNLFAVAEAGEQLAWLGAALRSGTAENRLMSSTPYIRELRSNTPLTAQTGPRAPAEEGICSIGFHLEEVDADSSNQGSCWRGLFRNPVVVCGYPVLRGQITGYGAQVPLDIASALINTKKLVKWAGTTFIKGFSALLVATKVVRETVLWHLVYNDDGSYISYEDPRIPRWPETADPFAFESTASCRHVMGWCEKIISRAGGPDANYSIEWSGLPGPNQSCALEKITLSGGQFVNVGLSCVLGLKDKPLHINFGDDYYGTLDNMADRHIVFFDPKSDDRRGWLLDGASAVLHLLRASIKNYREGRLSKILCSPDNIELNECSDTHPAVGSRAAAAFEVLSNSENLAIPLYPMRTRVREERTAKLGTKVESLIKEETTYFTVRDRIDQICHILRQITAHYDDVQNQSGVGFRLRSTPRRQLEGFDFMDVATGRDTLRPKVATLKTKGLGWVDFTRSLRAPTLFGSGFGDLFTPSLPNTILSSRGSNASAASCSACLWNTPLPKGKDYLAATISDLQFILRRQGNGSLKPWRLVDDVYWYTPDLTFGPCTCTPDSDSDSGRSSAAPRKCDRVQVLLPSSFPKLWGRASPRKLNPDGAVIFGHSAKFPLRYGEKRGSAPEVGEPGDDFEDVGALFEDSGIGTSLGRHCNSGVEGGALTPLQWSDAMSAASGSLKPDGRFDRASSRSSTSAPGLYQMANEQFVNYEREEAGLKRRGNGEDVRRVGVKRGRRSKRSDPKDSSESE